MRFFSSLSYITYPYLTIIVYLFYNICSRLIWCPYLNTVEEDGEEEDTSCAYLLLLTHGQTVEIWDLNTVIDEHGTGPLRPEVIIFSVLDLDNIIYLKYTLQKKEDKNTCFVLKGEPDFCHFLVIGGLKPFLDRNNGFREPIARKW